METKKQPWDRILKFRFHATILCRLFQAAEKAGLTKVLQLRSKRVFSTFPIGAKRKNSLGIEFYNFGFMPPFWVGFSKQHETPLGSNSTRSVSYYYFGWAFARSAKSQVDEVPPIVFKTRFFDFPHRGEWKKHPWDRIPPGRFHTTILGGLFPAAQKAGLTKVVQLRSKLVFSTFPIGTKPKSTLGSNSTSSVSYHHFGRAFGSSEKSRVDEGRPIAFKTRFFDLPNRGETKKHPLDRIPRGRFHTTILGGLFPAAQKAGLTNVVQLRSKLVFSTFPIGAKRKNTLGSNSTNSLSYHHFGRALPRSGKRRVDEKRPIALKTRFFEFPHMGETKKHPLDRLPRGRFDTTILGGLFPAAQKAGLTKVVQLR